jgi:hypothetical protein
MEDFQSARVRNNCAKLASIDSKIYIKYVSPPAYDGIIQNLIRNHNSDCNIKVLPVVGLSKTSYISCSFRRSNFQSIS